MAKASSNDILGLGKPLRSGQGAIRQFWNPIKPKRGPAARQFWNPIKPAKAPVAAWLKHFGPGEAFEIGTRGHPSVLKTYKTKEGAVLKPHKTSQGASRSMAKASSNDILGLGKPLRSGQGAIRQFWNPIKPERGPAAAWLSQLQRHFGLGEAFGIGTGGHPSVSKSHKTSQGASRSMAKASSNDILGLGKPLRSGQGAIRQFWNPIKPERGPAAARLKPAPTTFWAWGSLWDRDRGPSVSFEIP